MRKKLLALIPMVACGLGLSSGLAAEKTAIRHRGFEDFRKGTFADGGANTYVSAAGVVQLIHRWDINADGYLDLLFGQDHDHVEKPDALIYWGDKAGYRSLFPPFWRGLPAFKLKEEIERRGRHVGRLPTDGGGPVRIVDLNRDGYLDVAFPNTIHNYSVHMKAYVYWGAEDGFSVARRTALPTLFARDLAIEDLNRDGYPELVLANFGNEIGDRWGYKNHLESYIYWGAAEGFSIERRTSIATESAVSCASGDFNGDGWPDLAFANNNLRNRSVYVYFGGKEGFNPKRRVQLEGGNPGVVRAGQLDGDQADELILCSRQKGAAIYRGSSDFSLTGPAVELPAENVRDAAAADFNRDGHVDLVFASQTTDGPAGATGKEVIGFFDTAESAAAPTMSEVYFGSEAGFDPRRRLLLPTLSPEAVAAADLNGDDFAEIIFANSHGVDVHGVNCYDVPSYVYWGAKGGFDPSRRTHLMGFGPVGVAADDLDRNGTPDIVLMNQLSGHTRSHVPSVIFWGNAAHHYSEANVTLLPTGGVCHFKVAELNDDGHPDLLFGGSIRPSVYWGSAGGFRDQISFSFVGRGVTIRDFNRDGRLDLCYAIWSPDPRQKSHGLILWGTADGYSTDNSTKIPLKAYRAGGSASSADLDKDGYLDLVFPCDETPSKVSEIVWGGPDGFPGRPSTLLTTDGVLAPAIADLDGNGYLDLIFPGSMRLETQNHHTETLIYWGSEQGFSDSRRTGGLEAFQSCEIAVADLNQDGHLDLVQTNYKSATTRSLPAYIFWGGPDHQYSNRRRSLLPAESSCGVQVLDLNQDTFLDVVVHNHIKNGDHTYGANIYWGGAEGYSIERRTHMPTVGTHYAMNLTPGNVYDRSPQYAYHSPVLALPAGQSRLTLQWEGQTPHNTAIRFELRTASDRASIAKAKWIPITPKEPFSLPPQAKQLQYSAVLISPDGGSSPLLREVRLVLE